MRAEAGARPPTKRKRICGFTAERSVRTCVGGVWAPTRSSGGEKQNLFWTLYGRNVRCKFLSRALLEE